GMTCCFPALATSSARTASSADLLETAVANSFPFPAGQGKRTGWQFRMPTANDVEESQVEPACCNFEQLPRPTAKFRPITNSLWLAGFPRDEGTGALGRFCFSMDHPAMCCVPIA